VPLYEYQCKSCHTTLERIQKFSDPPLTVCPHCGGELEQLLSAPAVQFKGAGWYVTDYARKGSSGSGKDGKGASDSGAKSSGETSAPASGGSSSEAAKPATSTGKENK
jgi:putative FmdB family regulatory protein